MRSFNALDASLAALGALAGALGATAATEAPLPSFCFLAGFLAWVVLFAVGAGRRRPRRHRPRLRLRGGHDKAEDGGAAGCWL
jgi:hypothetical protein